MLSGIRKPEEAGRAMERALVHMTRLIEDLLDMTRLDAGTLMLERLPTPISILLDDAMELLQPVAESRRVGLHAADAHELPILQVDRRRVLQILWNLMGNGLKFTLPGGQVTVGAEVFGDQIRFAVSDTGPGIPADHLDRLFERYWQGQKADRRGAGLGLSIARSLVEAHGGRIWATSTEGVGTTFFFTLPLGGELTEEAAARR